MSEVVRWLDWNEEAFRRARAEDKPILLSIHVFWDTWCRLMDRDTYGDANVAMVLNRDYIPVRVDADRRPDINERYNIGSWPSTVFLSPNGELLWGANSVAPNDMKQLLVRFREGFTANRARLGDAVRERDALVRKATTGFHEGHCTPDEEIIRKTVRGILAGFGPAPHFPMTPSLRLLLREDPEAPILRRTLDLMAQHALWDSIDGGFHRLCFKEGWSSPRTEKLAADNGRLARLYWEAGQALGESRYCETARATLRWAERTLFDGRAFAASQAAADAGQASPPADRTVIAESNAEMASAFLLAGIDGPARCALDFLLAECGDPDRGIARFHDGKPGGWGVLRDQAYVARALIDAYEALGETRYITEAERLVRLMWDAFWDEEEQGLLDRRPGADELGELRLKRKFIVENAVACEAALRLWHHTGQERLMTRARQTLAGFPDYGESYGHHTADYAMAVDWLVRPATVITTMPAPPGRFVPRRVVRWSL